MQMMQKPLTDVMQTETGYAMIDPKFVIWSLSIKEKCMCVCACDIHK